MFSILFPKHFAKCLIVWKTLYSKKGIGLISVFFTIPIVLNTIQRAILFLILLMICDFITGIGASVSREKSRMKKNPGEEKRRIISSEKLKGSGVKFLLYSLTILSSFGMQEIFILKSFKLPVSDLELNLTLGVIAFWCIVELYSIFFENFKDMGIDIKMIFRKLTSMAKFIKEKTNDVCENEK